MKKVQSLPAEAEQQLAALLEQGETVRFSKGQVLFYEGHEPYGIWVVRSGKVKVVSSGLRCTAEAVWHSRAGDILGMWPLYRGRPFCCTGTAQTRCELVFISKSLVEDFLRSLFGEKSTKDNVCDLPTSVNGSRARQKSRGRPSATTRGGYEN